MSEYMDYLARCVGYMSYDKYLKSEHWLLFAAGVRDRRCFCCHSNKSLQVHHIDYSRLGQELPTDVVTVCDSCHQAIHEIIQEGQALLQNAHWLLSNRKKKEKGHKKWVSNWRQLLNKSKGQTITDLQSFLEEKGLLVAGPPWATEKAHRLGFAKMTEGKLMWNLPKYISMMQADKKLKKQLKKGKPVHPALRQRSLCESA